MELAPASPLQQVQRESAQQFLRNPTDKQTDADKNTTLLSEGNHSNELEESTSCVELQSRVLTLHVFITTTDSFTQHEVTWFLSCH